MSDVRDKEKAAKQAELYASGVQIVPWQVGLAAALKFLLLPRLRLQLRLHVSPTMAAAVERAPVLHLQTDCLD
jgi:hypothetical protein